MARGARLLFRLFGFMFVTGCRLLPLYLSAWDVVFQSNGYFGQKVVLVIFGLIAKLGLHFSGWFLLCGFD